MKHVITTSAETRFVVDEFSSIGDIHNAEPKFFTAKFGKRETFDMYRGFLICRCTVTFSDNKPERKTTVYMFGYEEGDAANKYTLCVSSKYDLNSTRQAKQLIDQIITKGAY